LDRVGRRGVLPGGVGDVRRHRRLIGPEQQGQRDDRNEQVGRGFRHAHSLGSATAMTHSHDDFSERFPILRTMTFLNHAAVAPLSGPAALALHEYADHAASRAYVDGGWYRRAQEVKSAAARLIGA